MKTGIFSGSFNPVHIGHLALANYLCEYEGLDEVWFLVTPHNPLKVELISKVGEEATFTFSERESEETG